MNKEQAFKVVAATGAAFALQGCVAVIPLAAGGLMTQSRTGDSGDQETEQAQQEPAAQQAAATPAISPEVQTAIAESAASAETQATAEEAPADTVIEEPAPSAEQTSADVETAIVDDDHHANWGHQSQTPNLPAHHHHPAPDCSAHTRHK